MPRAIRIHETGGPEVMRLEDVDVRAPARGRGAGAAHRHRAQLHRRLRSHRAVSAERCRAGSGARPPGVVSAVGKRRARISRRRSRRVRACRRPGSYCGAAQRSGRASGEDSGRRQRRAGRGAHAQGHDRLLSAAAHCYRVKRGDVIVVHAAAGGVGLAALAVGQGAGRDGRSASSAAKRRRSSRRRTAAGTCWCAAATTIAASVKKISKGLGAHVVYDGVGKDTFIESLDCLRKRGHAW